MNKKTQITLYDLSHPQKRIWYSEKKYPGLGAANLVFLVKLDFKVDNIILEAAINAVVRAHQGMRMRITESSHQGNLRPCLYIEPHQDKPLDVYDFNVPGGTAKLKNWAVDQTSQAFEFLDSDLFYFALVRHDDGKSGYYMKLHHIIADGTTLLLLFRDIKNTYLRLLEGKSVDFSDTPSYLDYLSYEQSYLNSENFCEDKQYWEEQMLPLPEEINLSGSRSADDSMAAGKKIMAFDTDLREGMRKWVKKNDTSVFKLIYTAIAIYISRITGMDDFVLPTFNHNRSIKEQYEMAGMFISTIPVRLKLKGDDVFGTLVNSTGDLMNYLIKNRQRYPFDELLIGLREKSGIDPSFFMNVSVIGHQDVLLEDMSVEHIQPPYEAGGLSIHVNPENKDILGILEMEFDYKQALYSDSAIDTLFKGICHILSAGIKHPEQKIKTLPIIDKKQTRQVIYGFNATEKDYNLDTTLVHLFDKQVQCHGSSSALVLGNDKLSYDELAQQADCLAFRLSKAGVGPETIVGLIAGRRMETIISILAILKAGGAYLPIDPQYPQERILYILKDSGARLLLAHGNEVPTAYTGDYFDLSDGSFFTATAEKLPISAEPQNAAYVIYTSGSTGQPKGVVIEHRSVVNLVNWHSRAYGITAGVKTAEYASFSFDASVSQIFSPLLNGAELHLIPDDIRLDPIKINDYLEANQIVYVDLPTPMCEQFLEICDNRSLKVMTTGGEKLKKYRLPRFKLVDEYGPTENTVISTHIHLDKNLGKSPIGKPVPNTRAYILDRYQNPLPLGVAGELYLAGAGLARGYLNRPELTLEKFMPDPFFPGQRMYRTGDLAKWLSDGNIDFLGRADFQVKIRGYRIELGEIEAKIANLAHVKDVVVDVRQDDTGSSFLCAWIEFFEHGSIAEVRTRLTEDLPDYMVPAFMGEIDNIPKNSSGKVDRRGLPEPDFGAQRQQAYEHPETQIEKKLAGIWAQVLGIKDISANDNFIRLGGHSLKALTMQYRIHKVFNISLPITQIFKLKNLRSIAALIEQLKDSKEAGIKPVSMRSFYPVTAAQKRIYLIHQMGNVDTAYNISLVMRIGGALDHVRLGKAIDQLVLRHEILRSCFTLKKGCPVLKIHGAVTAKRVFAETSPANVQSQIREFVRPFNLEKAPLFRTSLFRESSDSHVFVFDVHHIIMDGLSVSILVKELWDFYHGHELPGLEFGYKDFAVWQQETGGGRLPAQKAYWLEVFKGFTRTMNFETDHTRKATMDYGGGRVLFEITGAVKRRLSQVSEASGVTLFTTLVAAYGIFLMRHTACEDLVVGIPSSGRTLPAVENMVGMFVGTMPLRLFPGKTTALKAYLTMVNDTVMGALDHQDYPLEDLVEQLGVKREPGRIPLLDVLFTFREKPLAMESGDLRISPLDYNPKVAKFDQTFEAIVDGEGIQLKIEYKTALFERDTALAWGEQYIQLLEQICENPDRALGEYDIILPRERRFLVETFNNTRTPYPNQTVTEAVCQQARRTPDAVALKQEGRSITFGDLDRQTNRLANTLRRKGVGPGQVVGIVGAASIEFIVGILGVLKAGGAYVPVDVGAPANRINFMMEEAGVRIVLTTPGNDQAQKLSPSFTCLELEDEQTYSDNDLMPEPGNDPSDPIYIIYTSGSTGKPKGVMVSHKGILNYLLWVKTSLLQDQVLDMALYASLSFDLVGTSVFLPLLTGACMVIYPGEDKSVLVEKIIRENEVDVLIMTPSHLVLLDMVDCQTTRVKKLLVGGENLTPDLCRRIQSKFPQGLPIVNVYGPTETSVVCSWHDFNPATDRGGSVPIGLPADNARLYILDEALGLVPRGAVGELYIAGDGLADCYVNRKDLTDLAFLPNPFAAGERMYKTGDLVRMSVQGRIVYLGRKDHQVKIRGYRIETSEIEAVLVKYPGIKDVYVMAVAGDRSEDSFLCAYYTGSQGVSRTELKDFLLQDLPGYMVPSHFIHLDHLPMTPNGKTDRKALPLPGGEPGDETLVVNPQTPMEKEILAGFCKILKKNQISMTDNFFDLGGNSLKAVTLTYELKKHVEIGVNDIFKYQTPEKLARNLRPLENNLMKKLLAVKDRFSVGKVSQSDDTPFTRMESAYKDRCTPYETLDLSEIAPYDTILLAGVTGFLGIFLLQGLLEKKRVRIHLIIRAGNLAEAEKRLDSKWRYYFKSPMAKIDKDRIQIHAGDLSCDRLGLEKNKWEQLAQTTDCIINAAALVKHYGHYEEFVTANVVSVDHLIEFALHGRQKVFHQISTTSVGQGNVDGNNEILFTEFDTDINQKTDNFYLTTKLEAEKQIVAARGKGLTANIYRVGNIVFDSVNGCFQENIEDNGFFRQVRSYVAIGALPNGMDICDFSFVDQVAKAILTLFNRPALFNETFNIQNTRKHSIAGLLEHPDLNLPVQRMHLPQFVDLLMERLNFDEYRADIESLLLHLGWLEKKTAVTRTRIGYEKTRLVLDRLGFEWPALSPETARKFILETLKKRMEFLKSVRAFTGMPAKAIEGLALKSSHGVFAENSHVQMEGDAAANIFIVVKGFVEISKRSPAGWSGTMKISHAGDFVAMQNLSPARGASISIEAIMGEAQVIIINREAFFAQVLQTPELALGVMQAMADQHRDLEKLLVYSS